MKKGTRIIALCLAFCLSFCACGPASGGNEDEGKETEEIMQKEDPKNDDTINLLMIGNSFCYYYTDELFGMAKAAGVKLRVCNVYYSGCTLEQHWDWWKKGEAKYEYFTTDENGRKKVDGCTLKYCLEQQNWDFISLQSASGSLKTQSAAVVLEQTKTQRTDLWNYIKQQFPQSKHLWHQTWSYQIGYDRDGYKMNSKEKQDAYAQKQRDYALAICKEFDLERVNTGEAWKIVRDGGYDNLCARTAINAGAGDYYHDGDIGGGQYLNACVWFEVVTGKSCVGNTYRPTGYDLPENLIATLQQAAHQAVASR